MTLGDINTKITSLTGTDTNNYPNPERLVDINIWYQKIGGIILDSQDESDFDDPNHGDYPIQTVALTTNRDISIPVAEKILKMKDVTVFYDGVTGYRANPVDTADMEFGIAPASATTQNTTIDSNFARTSPRYDWKFGSLFIFPRASSADVAAGGYVIAEWFRQIKEFTLSDLTTGTVVPGFDDTFHAMLAYGPAFEYCEAKGLPQAATIYNELQVYEQRLRKQYSSKQLDRKYMFGLDYQNNK